MNDCTETFLSLESTADRLGLPASWLRREALAGRIPYLRVSRRLLFDVAAVKEALAAAPAPQRVYASLERAAESIGVGETFLRRLAEAEEIPGCARLKLGDETVYSFDLDKLVGWVQSMEGAGHAE